MLKCLTEGAKTFWDLKLVSKHLDIQMYMTVYIHLDIYDSIYLSLLRFLIGLGLLLIVRRGISKEIKYICNNLSIYNVYVQIQQT